MNKLFSKVIGASLAIAMMIGVGAGVNAFKEAKEVNAEDTVYYTLNPASGTNNSYSSSCDVAISGITWNITGNSTTNPWRIGGKSLSNVNRAVYSKTAMPSAITKVDLTVGAASNITVNSLKLIIASNADFSTVIDEAAIDFEASSTLTFNPTNPLTEWAENAYYKFIFNVSVSGNNNKYIEFTNAVFYAENNGGGGTPATYSVTYDANGATSGTVPTDDTAHEAGTEVTVLGNTGNLAKTGKVWGGWNTEEDGTGDSYSAGGSFHISENTTLYARWINDYSNASSFVITADYLGLNATGITNASILTANDKMQYSVAPGGANSVKAYNTNGSNAFDSGSKVILMGKNNAYIYNNDALQKNIGKLEIFANSGASTSVSVGVSFSAESACSSSFDGDSTTLSTTNHVYTFNPEISNAKYFRVQVTNANNAQIQIKISFSNPTTSVTVSPESVTLAPTGTQALTTTVLPANNTDTLIYSSSNEEVATVSDSGVITAVAVGTATITATSGEFSDTCEVTVELPQYPYITVETEEISGYTGQNEVLEFSYGNLSNLNIVSDDEEVATLDEPVVDGHEGLIQVNYVGAGTTTIKFNDGETMLDSVSVSVTASTVIIENMPASRAMANGSTLDLGAIITVTATGNLSNEITWSSDDTDIATVDNSGVVTAVEVGSATITATPKDYHAGAVSCTVTIARVISATFGVGTTDGSGVSTDAALKEIEGYAIDSNLEFTNITSMYAKTNNAIKMGAGSTLGKFTVGLINGKVDNKPAYITKIVVSAMKYGNDSTTIKIAGESKELTASFAEYDVEFNGTETTSVTIEASAKSNQRYRISNISIFYAFVPVEDIVAAQNTRSILSYHYVKHDNGTYSYSNVAIRFGALIEQALWSRLDTESDSKIDGYGVLVSDDTVIGNTQLKNHYDEANNTTIRDFFMPKATKAVPSEATESQKSDAGVEGDYYIWNRYHTIAEEDFTKTFVAVAYIKVDGQIMFMQEVRASVKDLAHDLIYNQGVAENTADGSLKNLADLVVA